VGTDFVLSRAKPDTARDHPNRFRDLAIGRICFLAGIARRRAELAGRQDPKVDEATFPASKTCPTKAPEGACGLTREESTRLGRKDRLPRLQTQMRDSSR
jgi:hypothetical protein